MGCVCVCGGGGGGGGVRKWLFGVLAADFGGHSEYFWGSMKILGIFEGLEPSVELLVVFI